jgi:hypothetical protein
MGAHDEYGKRVLQQATEGIAVHYGKPVEIDYGAGQPARIDATVGDIAVEIESRVSKQVRGALLDLICHSHPKKLLVLLPVHMSNPEITAEQCRNIMNRFCRKTPFASSCSAEAVRTISLQKIPQQWWLPCSN